MQQTSFFPHETLRAYQQAVQVSRWVSAARFPRGMAWAKDQAQRAAGSVALNIAEGWGRAGQAQRNHYEITYASASEARAALTALCSNGRPAGGCREAAGGAGYRLHAGGADAVGRVVCRSVLVGGVWGGDSSYTRVPVCTTCPPARCWCFQSSLLDVGYPQRARLHGGRPSPRTHLAA